MRLRQVILSVAVLCALSAAVSGADPSTSRSDKALTVSLGNATTLRFALHGDYLLGLNQAGVGGLTLTSDATVQRPILAQEFGEDRLMFPAMTLKNVRIVDGAVHVTCTLLATPDEQAYRGTFVYAGDPQAALGEKITPKLAALKKAADKAEKAFEPFYKDHKALAKHDRNVEKWQQKLAAAKPNQKPDLQRKLARARQRLRAAQVSQRPVLAKRHGELAQPLTVIQTFQEALAERAMDVGKIHRDFYRFPHLRQPEDICNVEHYTKFIDALDGKLSQAGELTWILKPVSRNIAGWRWVGWSQRVRFSLSGGKKVNAVRQLGTWELGGSLDDVTAVNLRYRGLGRIEHTFQTDGGSVVNPFTTTEIMPGAVGGGYAVSPKIPQSDTKELTDRGYALRHRAGAWICRMARGAGHGFVDFQRSPAGALTSFYRKQGNLRALSEAFPGDSCLSQTDEEYFALTDSHTTGEQLYLAMPVNSPREAGFWRTRWMEVDQHVRDEVSRDLKFVQYEVRPGIGLLSDAGWAGYYKGLAEKGLDGWAEAGVELVAYHNPGWINGRYQGPDGPPKTGGGVCNIYDWWPTKDVETPWHDFQAACTRRKVAFYPWLGQTQWKLAPFARRVGYDEEYWSLNTPLDTHGPGYGPLNMKTNALSDHSLGEYVGRLESVRKQFGYQGFWADSFQNLFMSQLDWAQGSGNSMQRAWWEQIAAWSRQGVGWMGESHSFPGMSCSIEVAGWEKDLWYFQHVWKWLRGNEQSHYTGEQLDELTFRAMAAKGWIAPDHSYKQHTKFATPSFTRLAKSYSAVLADMRRPYVLPGEAGVLWLTFKNDTAGVLFPLQKLHLPDGVTASEVGSDGKPDSAEPWRVYRVGGRNLIEAMGCSAPPAKDPRIGREYKVPSYSWTIEPEKDAKGNRE